MRFLKLLEIIALALLVFICIIGGDNQKNNNTDVASASKLSVSLPASARISR